MLLIHPTRKVANIARIAPVEKGADTPVPGLLNEWYVDLAGLGAPGKAVLLFVHRTTYVPVVVPGRSLKKALPVFLERLERLLNRQDIPREIIDKIFSGFSTVQFRHTNDRKTLGIINQYKYTLWVTFAVRLNIETFSRWEKLEDELLDYLHKPREGRDYVMPAREMKKLLSGS
jgi:hypothetical protein